MSSEQQAKALYPEKQGTKILNAQLFSFMLRRHRVLILVMAVCAALYSLMIVALWPLFTDDGLMELMEQMAAAMPGMDAEAFSMTLGQYIETQWLGVYWLPLAGAVMIVMSAKAIAGGVADNSLETIFAYPVARITYLNTFVIVLVLVSFILSLATFLPIVLAGPSFEINLAFDTYVLLFVASWLTLLVFGLIVLLVSSFTRGVALAACAAVALMLLMTVLTLATPMVEFLEVFEPINLLHWWGSGYIIDEGSARGGLWIYLAIVGVVSLVLSYVFFQRRDLT